MTREEMRLAIKILEKEVRNLIRAFGTERDKDRAIELSNQIKTKSEKLGILKREYIELSMTDFKQNIKKKLRL